MGLLGGSSRNTTENRTTTSNQTLGADGGSIVAEDSTINILDEDAIEKSFSFASNAFEDATNLSTFAVGALSKAQANDAGRSERAELAAISSVNRAFEITNAPNNDITKYALVAVVVVGLGVMFIKGKK